MYIKYHKIPFASTDSPQRHIPAIPIDVFPDFTDRYNRCIIFRNFPTQLINSKIHFSDCLSKRLVTVLVINFPDPPDQFIK